MLLKRRVRYWGYLLSLPGSLLLVGLTSLAAPAQSRLYNPIPMPPTNEVNDTLSTQDIPTGQGGFARDYVVNLTAGDQLAIDLSSDSFDTIVTLLAEDGTTIGENDDGPDGKTNSLLFTRIIKTGRYIVRVRAFGEAAGGPFRLKLTRLRPVP
ncbi:PPC domain-containing protein [Trichothermofontia sichuanensis B231]|uniref:PPC domain-containing protein n=1 Tax=Trichothermofontia sichuanensis TaxID=3045816 RepID=UPI002245F759|nr:PPC domain-containing protein [Trichothermofontia sichuanensis]UZQ53151.1 PPC domain-containing protein [Trichothermofontia sichuanensis B231]